MLKSMRLFVYLIACCLPVAAQLANTTSLVGNVIDTAGAGVPDATITVINTATGDTYAAKTGVDGSYHVEFLKIGTYAITVKHDGFSTMTTTGVLVEINQTVRTDFTLKVGQVTERVEVVASNPPIATDEASLREVISSQAIAELPLNGRDALQLALTTPGVIQGIKAANGVPPGEDFIGAGTREIQNSISLDGISIVNNLITTAPFHPSPDAVQELEVQTGTYSAQYGAYLGVHLNVITKSGTNSPHGAVYEFLRNDKFDARNYFLSPTVKKAPLRQNQFGFEFDAPVMIPKVYNGKNKTFFLFDYEGLRKTSSSAGTSSVLTPLMRQGNFSEFSGAITDPLNGKAPFAGNIIPTARLSAQAIKALTYMPLPNVAGKTTNNLVTTFPNLDNFNSAIGRLDHNISSSARVFFRYAWQNENIFAGDPNPTSANTIPVETKNWVVAYTQTLGANMVNDIRVGRQWLATNALNYWYVNGLNTAGADLGIPGFTGDVKYANPGIPNISITSFAGLGNAATNWFQQDTTWQGTDSFTYTHGRHTIISGAELRKLITGRSAVNNANGLFNFDGSMTGGAAGGAADLLLGFPISDVSASPEIYNKVAEWRDGFFVVDNWQAGKKLTLNLGLRYELPTVPYTVNGFALILNTAQTAMIPTNPPQPGMQLIGPNHNDWAPRVGFAYRLTEKTVVRGGFGIYYNPNQTNTFTFLSNNPPFSIVSSFGTASGVPNLSLNNPSATSPNAAPAANSIAVISPNWNLPTERMNQWSFDVQQGLWKNAALEVGYLGSHSYHLDRSYFDNTPLPGPGSSINNRRPNQLFGNIRIIQNDEIGNYDGLSATVRQRTWHGATFLASYTWSHTLDVTTDSNGGGAPMNPYSWRSDYGNSNWDIRHRFISSFTYDLPFLKTSSNMVARNVVAGWQLNGILTLQGGLPFNVAQSADQANTGAGSQRPNLVGTPSNNCGDSHLVNCISTSAYALATQYTYGNEGRNIMRGPGLSNIDVSFFKSFHLAERLKLQFRAEFFNFLNTPSFNNPSTTLNFANAASFGNITSTRHDNRQIQFGLKLLF
jgi:hypothetical protein